MHPLIAGNLKSRTNGAALLMAVLGVLQESFPQILALLPTGGNAYLIGAALMIIMRNITSKSIVEKAAQPPAPTTTKQAGTARIGTLAALVLAAIAALGLSGCVTNQTGGQELSATGKVALQEIATIAVRRSIADSPRAAEKAQNIRNIAARLYTVADVATVTELRSVVDGEIEGLGLAPIDRADAASLLNIFEALLRERIGSDELNADALVQVRDVLAMIVAALPPVDPEDFD